ncbi:MAG: BMP family lipoprotein, partial [Acetivibrio ethanolgignens]
VLAPETILTSAMKRVDNACFDIAKACMEGNVESGVKTYDLASAGVDVAPTTDNLTDEIKVAVEDAKAKIIAGEIVVPTTQADFEAKYGDAYELD